MFRKDGRFLDAPLSSLDSTSGRVLGAPVTALAFYSGMLRGKVAKASLAAVFGNVRLSCHECNRITDVIPVSNVLAEVLHQSNAQLLWVS